MHHVLYALFDSEPKARAAMSELAAVTPRDQGSEVLLHRDAADRFRSSSQPLVETRAWRGLSWGALSGAMAGAVVGGVLSAFGFHPPGVAATMVFTSLGGGVMGALAGGLSGSGAPDPKLERLELAIRDGRVVVTFSAPSVLIKEQAHDIFQKHGAVVEAD